MKQTIDISILQAAMADQRYTKHALATAIGVDHRAVDRWLDGTSDITASNLRKLCVALSLSADTLLGLPSPPERERERERENDL